MSETFNLRHQEQNNKANPYKSRREENNKTKQKVMKQRTNNKEANEVKSQFFEKTNKIFNLLVRLIKIKK